jgi:inositol-polyphosphate multikinase
MYSASLLFVYEGDGVALRAAMEEASRPVVETPITNGDAAATNGVGIAELVNGYADADEDEDEVEDEDEELPPKIYNVKLIDFAHADFVPGQGPDENSLLGIRSVAEILRGIAGKGEGANGTA